MTDDSIALREPLEKRADADLPRDMITFAHERRMELGGAGPGRHRLWRAFVGPADAAQRRSRSGLETAPGSTSGKSLGARGLHAALAPRFGRLFPLIVGVVTLGLIGAIGWFQLRTDRPRSILAEANIGADTRHGDGHFIGWILGLLGLTALVGFPIGAALFVLLFTTVKVGGPWWRNALLAAGCIAARLLLADLLTLVHPGGVLQRLFDMPWWFA